MQRILCTILSVILSIEMILHTNIRCYAEDDTSQMVEYTVLMETSSGQVLEENNSNSTTQVGTLCKVMVALLVAEKVSSGEVSLDTTLTTSLNAQGKEGATIWLLQGEKMSIKDLLKGMLIGNANDSTVVLAEFLAGSESECVSLMNEKAMLLGLDNTHFTNVCGYYDINQYSTAYDMGLLGCEVLQYDFLCEIMSTYIDYLKDGATELVNENYLTHTYEGLTGIKASHLGDDNYSIVASAEKNGTSYLVVVLNATTKDSLFSTAKKLLNNGFKNYVTAEPSFSSELMKPLTVKGGVDFAVLVEPKTLKSISVAKGSNDIESVIFLPKYVNAPIRKGQRLGEVCFYIGDVLVYKSDLIATSTVEKMSFKLAFIKLFDNMLI